MASATTCTTTSLPRMLSPRPLPSRLPARNRSSHPPRSSRNDGGTTPASKPGLSPSTPAAAMSSPSIASANAGNPAVTASNTGTHSGAALLTHLQKRAHNPSTLNVYGKPFTKTELAALDAAVSYLSSNMRSSAHVMEDGPAALRRHLLEELLQDAAIFKRTPLPVVEGAMALLELLPRAAADGVSSTPSSSASFVDDPALFAHYRWQLMVGADVSGVQYIPAVEELEVSPDGTSFTLGTDLDFIFTGFSGPCEWLAPGHLSYTVRQVRIELRWPKAWHRAAPWLAWRRRLGDTVNTAAAAGDEPDRGDSLPTSPTCREDPAAPAATVPLPFPTNELLAFSCNGRVAVTRGRLTNGLILLLEVGTREQELRGKAAAGPGGGAAAPPGGGGAVP